MGNIERARRLIESVRAAGVNEFCVCAGSRNSPLLAILGVSDVRLFSFVDERSAAFFALGRARHLGGPVAVVTTSGTAVAELLPAAVEAHYSAVPLVLITADRPARFRGTGAPQSIEQVGIFGVYAETSLEQWSGVRALHLNIEFDEPLIDAPLQPAAASSGSKGRRGHTGDSVKPASIPFKRPLVILGGLASKHRGRVHAFARRLGAPVFAEALSGLRETPDLPLIAAGERMIGRGDFDGVIRIGNIPVLRFWRDVEVNDLPVVHFSDLPFRGITRGEMHPIEALPDDPPPSSGFDEFFADDRRRAEAFGAILRDEPESELALFRTLSSEVPAGAKVYLGNSLPIREWDLAATREPRGFTYEATRGANGIDGQLSTFFGQCDRDRENVCVVGDLTAIYDLNAPWIVPQLDAGVRFRIIVINNGGGRIFSRVASLRGLDSAMRERIIENSHSLRFRPWAEMWGLADAIDERIPDAEASVRVWERYDRLWE